MQDEAKETRLREKFSRGPKSGRGEVMERFLEHEIEASDWFAGAYVSQTTDFDDYMGTDLVLEWEPREEGGTVPRLAVDITSSDMPTDILGKIKKLSSGAEVKYYRSEVEDEKEMHIQKIPIVILGVDASLLPALGEVAEAQKKQMGSGRDKKASISATAFAEHPVRFLLLEQARIQLDAQVERMGARLASALQKNREKLVQSAVEAYRQSDGRADATLQTIGEIPDEFLGLPKDMLVYWHSMVDAKRIIDEELVSLLTELEEKTAEFNEVRTWLEGSETHRQIVSLAAGR